MKKKPGTKTVSFGDGRVITFGKGEGSVTVVGAGGSKEVIKGEPVKKSISKTNKKKGRK